MKVGDELEVKGPIPKFAYKSNMKKNIGERHDTRCMAAMWSGRAYP
jgi:hypothetical protein